METPRTDHRGGRRSQAPGVIDSGTPVLCFDIHHDVVTPLSHRARTIPCMDPTPVTEPQFGTLEWPTCPACQGGPGRAFMIRIEPRRQVVAYRCEHCTHSWEQARTDVDARSILRARFMRPARHPKKIA